MKRPIPAFAATDSERELLALFRDLDWLQRFVLLNGLRRLDIAAENPHLCPDTPEPSRWWRPSPKS